MASAAAHRLEFGPPASHRIKSTFPHIFRAVGAAFRRYWGNLPPFYTHATAICFHRKTTVHENSREGCDILKVPVLRNARCTDVHLPHIELLILHRFLPFQSPPFKERIECELAPCNGIDGLWLCMLLSSSDFSPG